MKKQAILFSGALILILIGIAFVIYYLFIRTSKSTEEKEPIISVSGAELVSTENYTPFEYYTTQELTEFSKNVKIRIKLVIYDSYLINSLSIRRKHGSYAIDTKNLADIKDGEQTIEYSPNENENMIGDHNILVQYTTKSDPNTVKNGATTNVNVTGEHLQMTNIEGQNSVVLEVTSPTINTQIITSQKLVTVKYNGKDIFDGDDVYLTPVVTTGNNKGFKINGTGRSSIQGKIFYFLNAGNKKMIGNKPSDDDDTLYITYKDNKISLSNKKTDFSNKLFDVTLTDDKAVTVSPPTSSSGYY